MELIYKDTARRIIDSPRTKEQMLRMLESIDPVPPESNDDAEFWRKRAEFYEKTCFDLIADMSDGVKIDSIIIDKNGIKFTKKQPDRKSVNVRKEISSGIDGTALV